MPMENLSHPCLSVPHGCLELSVIGTVRTPSISRKQVSHMANCREDISCDKAVRLDKAFSDGVDTWNMSQMVCEEQGRFTLERLAPAVIAVVAG